MSPEDNRRWRFAAALVAIALFYTIYVLYFDNLRFVEASSRGVRHVIRFATILLTYGIGLLAFNRAYPAWLTQLWHVFYLGVLVLLLLLGVYDFWTQDLPTSLREFIITIHELVISPIPFVVAGLVYRLAGARVTSS